MVEISPVFFPVRHYSPAAADFVARLLREESFDGVLIEGPADFNDRIEELYLEHKLPVAVYSFVIGEAGRSGAFYPFVEFSPEWQALQGAKAAGTVARFIDLPWRYLAGGSPRAHRYSDANFRGNPYIEALCEGLGVQEFDELWDLLFELPEIDSWQEYVERARALCDGMRASEEGKPGWENSRREAFMAAEIWRAAEELGPRLLVVSGGYHSSKLEQLLAAGRPGEEAWRQVEKEKNEREESWEKVGLELTPFTYGRLDRLSGYAAGLQGPALYEGLWESRLREVPFEMGPLISKIITGLRSRGELISTADWLVVETTARALAAMRGRPRVWRYELLDAMSTALVKEAQKSEYCHPYLMVAREVMTGSRRGAVDRAAGVPPLVREVQERLADLGLDLWELEEGETRAVALDLHDEVEREKSRFLHRCAFLGVKGMWQGGETDIFAGAQIRRLGEAWLLQWTPEFMESLVEASAYGTTLEEAVGVRALEWQSLTESNGPSAQAAGLMLTEVVLMGMGGLREAFWENLFDSIRSDGDFFSLASCLERLVFLHQFEDVLGTQKTEAMSRAWRGGLEVAFDRALWLYRTLGRTQGGGLEALEAIATLHQAAAVAPDEHRHSFQQRLGQTSRRVARDESKEPLVRGAAGGTCLRLGVSSREDVEARWQAFFDPLDVGDYLTGLFRMAREAFARERSFLLSFDRYLCALAEEEFLVALPALRMAFTFFIPREKLAICDLLFAGVQASADAQVSAADRQDAARLDRRILKLSKEYGIGFETEELEVIRWMEASDGDPNIKDLADESAQSEVKKVALPRTEHRRKRWRLVLGYGAQESLGGLDGVGAARDEHLEFLYGREILSEQNIRGGGRAGGVGESSGLKVPQWINGVHELFPKRTIERLEEDALERYALDGILTRPDMLERMEPSMTLLKAVLRCKPMMSQEVLQAARKMVRKVIEELREKWVRQIENPFVGARDPQQRSRLKIAKNFDARETIRRNLKYYDPSTKKLVLRQPYFVSRRRRYVDRWQVIVVVDQSGSMLESVIHAAITASIFKGVHSIRSHLLAFDTRIVDLTDECSDPVETLMSVQLGGGTNIGEALHYAARLVENPRRAIIVLITDFFEGGDPEYLFRATKEIVESGVQLLGLAALDSDATPTYDRNVAGKMVEFGAHVGAMTPGELAAWVGEKMR